MKLQPPRSSDELHELASRPTAGVNELLATIQGRVLVIGAGGKMGFHLTRMIDRGLRQNGTSAKVVAVSRFGSPGATELFDRFELSTLATDLSEPSAIDALPDAQHIFFLAGVKFGTQDDPSQLHAINVELPERIAERFQSASIVALSTGCVYPFVRIEAGGSVETDPPDPPGDYARSCLGREQAFASSRASLIRLNYSVDLRYGVLVDIAQKVLAGESIDLTMGHVNVIWQGDANAYIIQALSKASQPPFVLNVTGPRTLSVRQIAERFGELFEKPVGFEGVEADTAWLSNSERCQQLFGPPQVDEWTLVEWVAEWLLAGGTTLDKPTQFQVRDGRY